MTSRHSFVWLPRACRLHLHHQEDAHFQNFRLRGTRIL